MRNPRMKDRASIRRGEPVLGDEDEDRLGPQAPRDLEKGRKQIGDELVGFLCDLAEMRRPVGVLHHVAHRQIKDRKTESG